MNQIERISTRYVMAEDRLLLIGSTATGEVQSLWLTQRLLLRLLPVLLQLLQGEGEDSLRAELMRSFALQAAAAELRPQAPVLASAGESPWLARTVNIDRSQQAVSLSFRGAPGQRATLRMTPKALRQWLVIIHGAYRKAQWPPDVWPAWVSERALSAAPQALTLH